MTPLERVVARMPDGRIVTFEDGEVTGDAALLGALEAQTGPCSLVIGMDYEAASFRESGNAFKAAVKTLGESIPMTEGNTRWTYFLESEGTEPVPPGDLLIDLPPGTVAGQMAEYRREMREWRARRRRLAAQR